ncbi:hypothetical protein ACFPME_11405 [Rhodanobacter umsongensis]|uniref:Uncharacterized protein n=1 Tax=Rhodanobacter umsongensis TaxID=633153 RepID=A0ABW0JM78_9GAMM
MGMIKRACMLALMCGGMLLGAPVRAGDLSCKMSFRLSGWSVFYKAAETQALTKGNVPLALSSEGSGWNLGVASGAFIIK